MRDQLEIPTQDAITDLSITSRQRSQDEIGVVVAVGGATKATAGARPRSVVSTSVEPDEVVTTLFQSPFPLQDKESTAVMPADYAAKLLRAVDPQADIITPLMANPLPIPRVYERPARPRQRSVDDYLTFLRQELRHNRTEARRALIADYHHNPRLLARVLVALHARARHVYIYAEKVIHDTLHGGVIQTQLLDELDRMPGDGPTIVRLAICRP